MKLIYKRIGILLFLFIIGAYFVFSTDTFIFEFDSGNIILTPSSVSFNDTRLNATIDARATGVSDGFWSIDYHYIYNNSGKISLNESRLNATIAAESVAGSGSGNCTLENSCPLITYDSELNYIQNETARVNSLYNTYIPNNVTKLNDRIDNVNTSANINGLFADDLTVDATGSGVWANLSDSNLTSTTLGVNITDIDISYKNPKIVGTIRNTSIFNGSGWLYKVGDYVYQTGIYSSTFVITDVTNKSNPVVMGYIRNTTVLDDAEGVAVIGRYAYVTSMVSDSVSVIDVKNPSDPKIISYISDATLLNGVECIEVVGNIAYVGSYSGNRVCSIDISDPYNLNILDCELNSTYLGNAVYLVPTKETLFVTSRTNKCLTAVNISDPNDLSIEGFYCNATHMSFPGGADVLGKYAYVASMNNDSVTVIDISDPSNMKQVGYVTDSTMNSVLVVVRSGDYLYAGGYASDRLVTIDVSDPKNPYILGSIKHSVNLNGIDDIYIDGKYAYVTLNVGDGLSIIELSGVKTSNADLGTIKTTMINNDRDIISGGNLFVHGGLSLYRGMLSYGQNTFYGLGELPLMKLIKRNSGNVITVNDGTKDNFNITNSGNIISEANITTSENIGIDTRTPSAQLHIDGFTVDYQGAGVSTPRDTSAIIQRGIIIEDPEEVNLISVPFWIPSGGVYRSSIGLDNNTNTILNIPQGGGKQFKWVYGTDLNNEIMRLEDTGNLGINTTTPEATLHVAGTTKLDGLTNVTGNLEVISNFDVYGVTELEQTTFYDLVTHYGQHIHIGNTSNTGSFTSRGQEFTVQTQNSETMFTVNNSIVDIATNLTMGNGLIYWNGSCMCMENKDTGSGGCVC